TDVQFLKLRLTDADGKSVSENFYWRSNSKYEGKNTLTGPCTAGFQQLNSMKQASLKCHAKQILHSDFRFRVHLYDVDVTIRNNSKSIAFFNQLQLLDADNQQPIRPAYYDDNFFTLMPGESKTIHIETRIDRRKTRECVVKVSGWNVPEQLIKVKL
ncbi:MAG: glycoside hydrolase family 2, partial [Bacteroidales bacterium]|nr:glycoside hydrolase family 2 [Bacteroidales bacterium]